MALSGDSKIKEFVGKTDAIEIVAKYIPGFDPSAPQMKLTQGMSLKKICGFPQTGISADDAEKLYAELIAANID